MVFKRLHSYHEFEGTGVGLSLCKKIVEKHNGQISASSKINEGSKFTILLPELAASPELHIKTPLTQKEIRPDVKR